MKIIDSELKVSFFHIGTSFEVLKKAFSWVSDVLAKFKPFWRLPYFPL